MERLIAEKLAEIEEKHNVKIIYAAESGSRAWGFASPDSDYDVRFIYKRNKDDYLRLDTVRDVIELPINDVLDINGWDLDKTLRLLYKSNPTLFEWLASPIVYKTTPSAEKLKEISQSYFLSKSSLYHYLSMAKKNYRVYLKEDMVKAKKYFYVLRPLLACMWILEYKSAPPILFSDLMKAELPDYLLDDVNYLLDIKMNNPELKLIPKIQAVNDYIENSIDEISKEIENVQNENREWKRLNDYFLAELEQYYEEIRK